LFNEQKRFASQWKAFGAKLEGLYEPGKKGANEMKEVQSLLDEWGQKADASFWRGLNLAFQERHLDVKPFSSGSEFETNLLDFIKGEINDAGSGKKEESFKAYQTFHDSLWVPQLKPAWIPLLIDSGKISDSDRQELEAQIANWGSAVSPSRMWLYVLVIVVAIAIGYFLFRKKKTPPRPEAPKP